MKLRWSNADILAISSKMTMSSTFVAGSLRRWAITGKMPRFIATVACTSRSTTTSLATTSLVTITSHVTCLVTIIAYEPGSSRCPHVRTTRAILRYMTWLIALEAPIFTTLTVASNVAHLVTLVALLLALVIKRAVTSIMPGFITSVTRTVIFHFNVKTTSTKLKKLMKMRNAGIKLRKLWNQIYFKREMRKRFTISIWFFHEMKSQTSKMRQSITAKSCSLWVTHLEKSKKMK